MSNNLAEKFKELIEDIGRHHIDDFILKGLNPKITLRDYQQKAIRAFRLYYHGHKGKKYHNGKIHSLFQMATGSGKTVIMAALILFLYQQGYRHFIFFVSQTNILEKTKQNFSNPASSKYLFATPLKNNDKLININVVNNFQTSSVDHDSINICFTTIQKLHMDIANPREDAMSEYDFSNQKVVFISDESHHLNASTKVKNKKKNTTTSDLSWENTVISLYNKNPLSVLLEFSATAGLNDREIHQKYKDKIVFDYPLSSFRDESWTKNFENISSNSKYFERALIALVMSEYRRMLFNELGLEIKPVVLLKSKTIKDNKENFEEFKTRMKMLDPKEIEVLESIEIPTIKSILDYFKEKGNGSYQTLVNLLKESFREETLISIDSSSENAIKEKDQILLNSLEDRDNVLRAIFVVDQLNEGWDVLNLFDIVRLHDERQENTRANLNTYTIREAQLIGRGARYCPFIYQGDEERQYKRKFDFDVTNKYRILETLYYHCKNDSKYIRELKNSLIATGLIDKDEGKILEIKLKDEFRQSNFFNQAFVWTNKRVPKKNKTPSETDQNHFSRSIDFNIDTLLVNEESLFNNDDEKSKPVAENELVDELSLNQIDYHIVEGASLYFEMLKFNYLKRKFANLKSLKEFLTSNEYLGDNFKIKFCSQNEKTELTGKILFKGLIEAFKVIEKYLYNLKDEYVGSDVWYPKPLKNVIDDKSIYVKPTADTDGRGHSQSEANENLRMNLNEKSWYVFNDNYGTSEEKQFVKWFSDNYAKKLESKNFEFYLVRNERFSDLAIYDLETGDRFEPDFLLYIKTEKNNLQFFIEPKGSQLISNDQWKETLLDKLNNEINFNHQHTGWKVIGMPFFNREDKLLKKFKAKFEEFIESLV